MVNFINEIEFEKLHDKELTSDHEPWKLRNNLHVHKIINKLFDENKLLRLICFNEYQHLEGVGKPLMDLEISKLPEKYPDLDHNYSVLLNHTIGKFQYHYLINGIFNFPYVTFDRAVTILSELGDLWEGYIINPYLMRYNNAVGMYYQLNITHINDYINDINGYVKKHTGYDLFYKATHDTIEEIVEEYPVLTKKNFVKLHTHKEPFSEYSNHHIGWNKLLQFWGENNDVKCKELDNYFEYYMENMGYTIWGVDWNLKTIDSARKFILYNPVNNDKLGPFNHMELDLSFNCIYTGGMNELTLTDEQVNDLRNGGYDFQFIKE
ncbi:MAG: hypothetical protein IJH63_10195 [Methanobrevibacter sp.]|nr:hypothetical protein [Methanosphaera sp.]MBR0371069.1 hypothetical protein [Methanobrevibacter sp.]